MEGKSHKPAKRPPHDDAPPFRKTIVWPQRIDASRKGMASTQHYLATNAATRILREGGNAVDAAVAAAFALGVCEPAASGLGGQTMMTLYLADSRRTIALDGSSRAPHRALPGGPDRAQQLRGHQATTVPSTPAALAYALQTFGTLDLAKALAPAIELAEEGIEVTELLHTLMKRKRRHLVENGAGIHFLRNGEKVYSPGARLHQPILAKTLERLAREGVEDFYQGEIARRIHADMKAHGGLIQADDLAQIPWPIERKPVTSRFAGLQVVTFPPPGAGRTLLQMCSVLERFPPHQWRFDHPQGALLLAEVIRRANLDRRDRPFDPNFYPQIQDRRMLSREYAELVGKQIRHRIRSHGETTHLSVMDNQGNAVALTQSIEQVFGSCVAAPDLGFLYNNYMSAFDYDDISHPYYLRPNAVPWASVAPTIVLKRRRPWLAIGSPGSERIASAILQVLVRLFHQSPIDAVVAPRLHCSVTGKVSLEASRMRGDIPPLLEQRGLQIDRREPFSFYMGCVQLVMRDGKEYIGVADPRRDGAAAGPDR